MWLEILIMLTLVIANYSHYVNVLISHDSCLQMHSLLHEMSSKKKKKTWKSLFIYDSWLCINSIAISVIEFVLIINWIGLIINENTFKY